ncbi:MAG TPA: antitermination protein NusB [Chiayiivirga sp.]|nr:antitermination protein NusB [Chiayiivirga sp.]
MNVTVIDPGYTVGWLTLALLNAGLAQGKNRSGLIWFLISLLLGPIATALLVLMAKLPSRL